jgi:hypothetical protein
MGKEYVFWIVVVAPFQCGEFNQDIKNLYGRMVIKIINMWQLFLGFV